LLSALEDTLLHSMNTAHVKGNAITIRDETSLGSLEEERSKYEITAKLFYLPSSTDEPLSVQVIDVAIQDVNTVLGTSKIDHFILSLPKQVFDENGTDEEELREFDEELERSVLPVWSHLSALRQSGQIGRLGVAEFSKQQLELLKAKAIAMGGAAPEINQVNLADCCVLPKDLVEYAKQEGIELLTHGDAHDLLPQDTFAKLLEPYLTASLTKLRPNFVVKYSAFIHSRGLVTKKGVIIPIIYWSVLFDGRYAQPVEGWRDVSVHAMDFVLIFIEVILNRMQMTIKLFIVPFVVMLLYMFLTWIIRAVYGYWVYPFLSWQPRAGYIYPCIAIFLGLVYCVVYSVHLLKEHIWETRRSQAAAMNGEQQDANGVDSFSMNLAPTYPAPVYATRGGL
ncbi:hypothetical protein DFQ26_007962, partial [Actinomortierella ambigua]